jgi:hypothetical protein
MQAHDYPMDVTRLRHLRQPDVSGGHDVEQPRASKPVLFLTIIAVVLGTAVLLYKRCQSPGPWSM